MFSTDGSNVGRTFKQPNETAVWTSELESAFVEALQVHPPMGKRRIKYLVSSGDPSSCSQNQGSRGFSTKSFGRYQLIQAYIYAKTGQTRTRKQISSHIQRFKNLNRDNPSALVLVQEATPSLSASGSPAVFDYSFGLVEGSNSATTNESAVAVETLSPAEETTKPTFSPPPDQNHPNSLDSLQKQPNGFYRTTFIVPQLVQTMDEHPRVDKSSKTQENLDENVHTISPSTRVFGTSISNTSSFVQSASSHSMTQRRLASNIPVLQTTLQLSSHPLCAPMFSVPALSSSNQAMVYYASSHNHNAAAMSFAMPVTPVDQLLHTPPQPPEIQRQIRMKSDSRADEHSAGWLWPVADSSLDAIRTPFGLPNSHSPQTSADNSLALDYLAETQQLSSSSPQLNNFSTINSPHPRLPRRLSYSQSHAPTSSPLVFNNVSSPFSPHTDSRIDPFYNENLASPLDIKIFSLKATHTHFDSTFSSMGSPLPFGASPSPPPVNGSL